MGVPPRVLHTLVEFQKKKKKKKKGDQSHPNRATLTGHLGGYSVRTTNLVTPEATSDWHNGKFGEDDGTSDGSGHLFAALHTKSHVSVVVSDSHEGLKSGSLTGSSLLLDRHDLQHLILQILQEVINDLKLFDGQREQINILKRLDLTLLYKTAKLGDWNPPC